MCAMLWHTGELPPPRWGPPCPQTIMACTGLGSSQTRGLQGSGTQQECSSCWWMDGSELPLLDFQNRPAPPSHPHPSTPALHIHTDGRRKPRHRTVLLQPHLCGGREQGAREGVPVSDVATACGFRRARKVLPPVPPC